MVCGGGGGVNQQVQYEQQKDLAQTTAELEVAKQKEADLEQQIKALESEQERLLTIGRQRVNFLPRAEANLLMLLRTTVNV